MHGMWAVCRREFASYFITPMGYIVVGAYTLITGLGFVASFLYFSRITRAPADFNYPAVPDLEEVMLSPYLVFTGQVMLFLAPLITMWLLAEERNRGTMELLLTYPLRDRDIILGKYFASLGVALVMMSSVAVHLGIVAYYAPVEPAVLIFGLLAVFMMSAAFLSIGLFVSSFTRSPVSAATISFGAFFVSYVLGSLGKDLAEGNPAPAAWPEQARLAVGFFYRVFRQLVLELPIDAHARNMAQGIVEPQDIVYYLLVTGFFLFLTFRVLDARRWRAVS